MYFRMSEVADTMFFSAILQKKNVLKGVGRPWVHFLYSSPGKKMYWRGWDPLQYIFIKKCTGIRGTYFCSIFFFLGGFWAKKNVLKGVGPPWLHFFLLFFPCCTPPPPLEPTWGGPKYIFNPPPPHLKNVHYIFGGPPLKLGVKGVGMLYMHGLDFRDWKSLSLILSKACLENAPWSKR